MSLRLLAVALTLTLPLSVTAQSAATIRLLNATGYPLNAVEITPCNGGAPVAGLNRGERIDPYGIRYWSVPPGCYVVSGNGTERRLIVNAGTQFDAALI